MNSTSQQDILRACLLEIESKLSWGTSSRWHHDAFEELSIKIKEKTGVLLSATTLKRVWGKVNYNNAPSISTLNALAQFADYEHWRDFLFTHQKSGKNVSRRFKLSNQGIIITSACFMTVLFISFYSLIIPSNSGSTFIDYNNIQFSSRPITSGIPNSVVFDFNLGASKAEHFRIQQYWDETKTVNISKDQTQATGIYYYPGYFRAKLLADSSIMKEHDLFIKSDGWLGTIDYEPVPKYITKLLAKDNTLKFTGEIIKEVRSSELPLQTSFHLVDQFNTVSGGNFSFNTDIKHLYLEKWATCQKTRMIILGTEGALIIPFSIAGCASDNNIYLNGEFVSGKENDLSALTANFSDFQAIEIAANNNKLSISINNKKVFETEYQRSIGELVGIRIRAIGIAELRNPFFVNALQDTLLLGNE